MFINLALSEKLRIANNDDESQLEYAGTSFYKLLMQLFKADLLDIR